jgi:hypothetical protein
MALDLSSPRRKFWINYPLNRLGKAAGRAYAASVERMLPSSKPRLLFLAANDLDDIRFAAFTLDGNVLGVFVTRSVRQKAGEVSGRFGA